MAMNLSPDQKRDFVKARQALIARNEDIKEKRRRIVGDLEVRLVPPELTHASPPRLALASRTGRRSQAALPRWRTTTYLPARDHQSVAEMAT